MLRRRQKDSRITHFRRMTVSLFFTPCPVFLVIFPTRKNDHFRVVKVNDGWFPRHVRLGPFQS